MKLVEDNVVEDNVVEGNVMAMEEPGWLRDRASLLTYRLRAAWYGLMFRLRYRSPNPIDLINLFLGALGVLLGVLSLGIGIYFLSGPLNLLASATKQQLLGVSISGALIFGTVLWITIRYLGNLSMVMRAAASTQKGAQAIRKHMAEGMLNADAYMQLRGLYEEPVKNANQRLHSEGWQGSFEFVQMHAPPRGTHDYAAIALSLEEPTRLENIIEAVKANTPPPPNHKFSWAAESRQALMSTWRSGGNSSRSPVGDDEEGNNYHLLKIRINNESGSSRLVIDVGVATYGQIVRTCDALINEFALYAYITRFKRPAMRSMTFLRCLPWRRRTHEQEDVLGDLFLKPLDRAAGLGVAIVTVNSRSQVVGLVLRSKHVGTYPSCLHVIPAGMCNTKGTEQLRGAEQSVVPDWFVRTTMRSEFLEELYADTALETDQIVPWQEYVDDKWKDLEEDVPIMLTGLSYDLLNLRPEICGVVLVKKWGGNKLNWRLNWEGVHLEEAGSVKPTDIVQSGAAALFLAQRRVLHKTKIAS